MFYTMFRKDKVKETEEHLIMQLEAEIEDIETDLDVLDIDPDHMVSHHVSLCIYSAAPNSRNAGTYTNAPCLCPFTITIHDPVNLLQVMKMISFEQCPSDTHTHTHTGDASGRPG